MTRVYEYWEEPEDHGAQCPDCGKEMDLDDCEHVLAEEMPLADGPDGLPCPVLIAVCRECEQERGRA